MPLEQREPTKSLNDRRLDVGEAFLSLNWMRGYPATDAQMAVISTAVARFVQTVEVNHACADSPKDPLALGWVNPLAWLVGQIAETCDWFPAPIKIRQIYEQRFTPLDGKNSADMLAVIE